MKRGTLITIVILLAAKLVVGAFFLFAGHADPAPMSAAAAASQGPTESAAESTAVSPMAATPASTESRVDFELLMRREIELKQEALQLEGQRKELAAIQRELDQKIDRLQQLREEILSGIKQKEAIENEKLQHLIKAYSAMKPQNAADLVEKLDLQLAIDILANMKSPEVAGILSFLAVEKAARISEGLVARQ